jgi:peptide/nickel transport system ATP-binding protein
LKLRGVEKSHFTHSLFSTQETKVLHDIDITIHQGDIVGLIGESGSGKSTIAKLILKIWEATQGEIYYDDKDIKNISDLSNDIQLVFQDPFSSLNPKHKIGKAISEVLRTIDKRASKAQLRNKVVLLLQEVGLTASDFDKYPHEFSGGQRQRICIAKSLAKNPKIIVLDEAVSALDVSVQAKVLNLLNDLKRKNGLTYLLISHDMNVVSYFCNKIVVLKQGKIVEIGKTERLISAPQSDYTKTLLEHSIK